MLPMLGSSVCRARVGEGSSGDVRVVIAQHGGVQSPSLMALGLPAVRLSSAPAFHPPPRVVRLPQKRPVAASTPQSRVQDYLGAVFFQASTYKDVIWLRAVPLLNPWSRRFWPPTGPRH